MGTTACCRCAGLDKSYPWPKLRCGRPISRPPAASSQHGNARSPNACPELGRAQRVSATRPSVRDFGISALQRVSATRPSVRDFPQHDPRLGISRRFLLQGCTPRRRGRWRSSLPKASARPPSRCLAAAAGLIVLRLPNHLILHHPDRVLDQIRRLLATHLPAPLSAPERGWG